jgi:gluconate transporter
MTTPGLVALTALAVALLLFLVLAVRLHAFLALLVTSLAVALAGGIPLAEVAGEVQRAMGASLGYIAVVIGVGAIFGELLRQSGGAAAVAGALLRAAGEKRAPWALGATGLVVAIPVFFDVAFILFVPLLRSLARRTGRPLLGFAVPLLAGLAVGHAFIPPTPGPVAVAGLLGADLGWVIAFGLAAGVPALTVGGLWYGSFIAPRLSLQSSPPAPQKALQSSPPAPQGALQRPTAEPEAPDGETPATPFSSVPAGAASAVGLIALPLVLILAATASGVVLDEDSRPRDVLQFLGHPFSALILTTLAAFYVLGTRRGFSRQDLESMASRSLLPVGQILLVTGAGGVLGKVLVATGVGEAVAGALAASRLPLVALAFALAAAVRVVQGSATVAMVTAGGLVVPIVEAGAVSGPMLGAVTVAIAAGATVLSHVNDSGFWLVSRYLDLSERDTLESWTVVSTLVGATGFAVVLGISYLIQR